MTATSNVQSESSHFLDKACRAGSIVISYNPKTYCTASSTIFKCKYEEHLCSRQEAIARAHHQLRMHWLYKVWICFCKAFWVFMYWLVYLPLLLRLLYYCCRCCSRRNRHCCFPSLFLRQFALCLFGVRFIIDIFQCMHCIIGTWYLFSVFFCVLLCLIVYVLIIVLFRFLAHTMNSKWLFFPFIGTMHFCFSYRPIHNKTFKLLDWDHHRFYHLLEVVTQPKYSFC